MIPKQNRLKRMKDFDILLKEGWFVGDKLITAKVWKINTEKYPRRKYTQDDLKIGFVVSKKVSNRAVGRNRIKRQMREVVRLLLKENKLRIGFMVMIMAKPEALGENYKDIEESVLGVLKKGGVMK